MIYVEFCIYKYIMSNLQSTVVCKKNACEQNETSSSIQCLSVEIGYLPIMIKYINNNYSAVYKCIVIC